MTTFKLNAIISESYIHSPNYPNDYPNNYDQVRYYITIYYIVYCIDLEIFLCDKIDCCRLGSCGQPMDKQSPSPLTLWILREFLVVLAWTGWRSMMDPPSSATVAHGRMVIITMIMVTISAPPSPAPSPAPPPLRSSLDLITLRLEVGS